MHSLCMPVCLGTCEDVFLLDEFVIVSFLDYVRLVHGFADWSTFPDVLVVVCVKSDVLIPFVWVDVLQTIQVVW